MTSYIVDAMARACVEGIKPRLTAAMMAFILNGEFDK